MYGTELDLSGPSGKHLLNQGWRSPKYKYFNDVKVTAKQKCISQGTSSTDSGSGAFGESKNIVIMRPIWLEK
jgi:hypothetical protein